MKENKVKDPFRLLKSWQGGKISRKEFLTTLAILAAGASIPFAFQKFWKSDLRDETVFSLNDWEIIGIVQDHLFPTEENSPGAKEINARSYLQWVMKDPQYDEDEKRYIRNGIKWLEESAMEIENIPFLELSPLQRESLMKHISNEDWGESWLSKLLSLIFEALFCDPIYGGNPDGIGWKWLSHRPGLPRPKAESRYGII